MHTLTYGTHGPCLILLHGGPAAPGYMAPFARRLSDSFRVLEPYQRGSGDEPLTVARHVEDLHDLVTTQCSGERPFLVGHSWGAMLALAYAAEYAETVAGLVLVGCGTFDTVARARMGEILGERMGGSIQDRLKRLAEEISDPDERLGAMGKLIGAVQSYDTVEEENAAATCDEKAHTETWNDMVRLQEEGVYPAAFSAINIPAIMLHGAYDPHPGEMIRDTLRKHIPHLEYHQWERCGHYPWRERAVGDDFSRVLREWITVHASNTE